MEKKTLSEKELTQVAGGFAGDTVISSGSFTSNSGTHVDLLVNWAVRADLYGTKTLYVDVSVTSYALYNSGVGVDLIANGALYPATSATISYGGSSRVTNHLASYTVPNVAGAVNLSVVWHFNGTLSGVHVGDIRANGIAMA